MFLRSNVNLKVFLPSKFFRVTYFKASFNYCLSHHLSSRIKPPNIAFSFVLSFPAFLSAFSIYSLSILSSFPLSIFVLSHLLFLLSFPVISPFLPSSFLSVFHPLFSLLFFLFLFFPFLLSRQVSSLRSCFVHYFHL